MIPPLELGFHVLEAEADVSHQPVDLGSVNFRLEDQRHFTARIGSSWCEELPYLLQIRKPALPRTI